MEHHAALIAAHHAAQAQAVKAKKIKRKECSP